MSGWGDSSVVAARVAASGLRAFGVTLALWPRDRAIVSDRGCCSIDSVDDARRVANPVELPHYVWNLEQDFEANVVSRFRGRIRRRDDAQTLRPLQPADQVRRAARACACRRGDPSRHRSLRAHRPPRIADDASPGSGPEPRSGVRPAPAGPGPARQRRVRPGRRRVQGGRPRRGGGARPGDRGQARIAGPVLRRVGHAIGAGRRLAGRFTPGPITDTAGAVHRRARRAAIFHGRPARGPRHRAGPAGCGASLRDRAAAGGNAVVVGPREALRRSSLEAGSFRWVAGRRPQPVDRVRGAAPGPRRAPSCAGRGDRCARRSSSGSTPRSTRPRPVSRWCSTAATRCSGAAMIRRAA